MRSARIRTAVAVMALTTTMVGPVPGPALADAAFTVDTTADTADANAGDGECADASGDCSMRAAVQEAVALGNTTTIDLTGVPVGSTITYTLGMLTVADATVVISGYPDDPDGVTVDGNDGTRLLDLTGTASVRLVDLTLRRGRALVDIGTDGGAVRVAETASLTADGVHFVANAAVGHDSASARDAVGGAISSRGDLVVRDSQFRDNEATGADTAAPADGGDAIGASIAVLDGSVEISDTTFTGNVAVGGDGGDWTINPEANTGTRGGDARVLHVAESIEGSFTGVELVGETATGGAGGDGVTGEQFGGGGGTGGLAQLVRANSVQFDDVVVRDSSATGGDGGVGAPGRSGGSGGTVAGVVLGSGGPLTIRGLVLTGGVGQGGTNAIAAFGTSGGDGGRGGSVQAVTLGPAVPGPHSGIEVSDITMTGGPTGDGGDGDGGPGGDGGNAPDLAALVVYTVSGTPLDTVTVADVASSQPDPGTGGTGTSDGDDGAPNGGFGVVGALVIAQADTNLTNVTVTGLRTNGRRNGMGPLALYTVASERVSLAHVTVTDNDPTSFRVAGLTLDSVGGIFHYPTNGIPGELATRAVVIDARPAELACTGIALDGGDVVQTTVDASSSYSADSDDSCGFGDDTDLPGTVDMGFGEGLAEAVVDAGVPTLPLRADSALLDAGPTNCTDAFGDPLDVDGRLAQRPRDGDGDGVVACDVGAHENPAPAVDPLPEPDPGPGGIARLDGASRVETAVATSQAAFPDGAPAVVLAVATNYPDALAGAPLAHLLGGPILLTSRDGLSPATATEVERLAPQRAVLLGGEGALSAQVAEDLDGLGIDDVVRFDGANRFDTAGQVAAAVLDPGSRGLAASRTAAVHDADGVHVYVTEGADASPTRGWPDALGVGPLAAVTRAPILLVTTERLPDETAAALVDLGVVRATVVGGPGAVSDEVVTQVAADVDDVRRIAGDSRYETSALVASEGLDAGLSPAQTWVATGRNFPDALAAGPAVARVAGSLLLVAPDDLDRSAASRDWIADRVADVTTLRVLGGVGAISDAVFEQLRTIVTP